MTKTPKEFSKAIAETATSGQLKATALLCEELTAFLFQNKGEFPVSEAEKIMNALRNGQFFEEMRKVGNAFVLTGKVSYTIHRQFAQAEIERGQYDLAQFILQDLLERTSASADKQAIHEHAEALGLLGRIYKQLFVAASNNSSDSAEEFLKKAIAYYSEGYNLDPEANLWHGINALALSCRTIKDNIDIYLPTKPEALAATILDSIERVPTEKLTCWDYATAAEAFIALEKWENAYEPMLKYVSSPSATHFAIAGTRRQLQEVWQAERVPTASRLLQLLTDASEGRIKKNVDQPTVANRSGKSEERDYESVFGTDTYKSLEWYMDGLARSGAVARIGEEASKGTGTGFLLKGSVLSSALGEDYVLLTNEHVLSDVPNAKDALSCEDAKVIFEKINLSEIFPVEKVYWRSNRTELDVSIVQFRPADQERINKIGAQSEPFPVANRLPLLEESQRVYIIGHPFGQTLSFSIQDNELLDYEEAGFRIHYRTPTDRGNSGSPVFNRNWKLIGIHHRGSENTPRLNGKEGTYKANEGISIRSIKDALAAAGK